MSKYHALAADISDRLALLNSKIRELRSEVAQSLYDGILWKLPAPKSVPGERATPVERTVIHPQPIEFAEIADIAGYYLGLYHFEQDQNPIYASRCPGVLQVSTAAIELSQVINGHKSALREMVGTVPAGYRRTFMKEVVKEPGIDLLYLYRHIDTLAPLADQVSFEWIDSQYKLNALTPEDAIRMIDRARTLVQDELWIQRSEQARERIRASDKPLFMRVEQPPKVTANVRLLEDCETARWRRFNASLPMLTDKALPLIRPLKPYERNVTRERKPRSNAGQYEPVFRELNIFARTNPTPDQVEKYRKVSH